MSDCSHSEDAGVRCQDSGKNFYNATHSADGAYSAS